MKRKRDGVKREKKSVKRKKERGKRGKERCVGMAWMPYPPNATLLILCINNRTFASSINNKAEKYIFR
ncbi:hypothetical protein [Leyella stercorea]|uniref:hypothetical protein n=1 Tax=Leyella stercorea TaxID=363265 RepID=UPI00242D9A5F|nr:hypothetical protein [Leyella stercorea]